MQRCRVYVVARQAFKVAFRRITDARLSTRVYYPGRLDPTIDIRLISVLESSVGDWSKGRYAWELQNVQKLDQPIAYTGAQGLRSVDGATAALLEEVYSRRLV